MANEMMALQVRAPHIITYNELVAGRDQQRARQNALLAQQQQMEQQNYVRQAGGSLDMTNPAAVQQFIAQGGPDASQMVNTNLAASQHIQAQKQAQQAEGIRLVGAAFNSVLRDPSDNNLDVVAKGLEGRVPRQMIDQELAPIRSLPVEQRSAAMQQLIMQDENSRKIFEATQPKPQQFNLGGSIVVRDMNPLSPTFKQTLSEDALSMTPTQSYQAQHPNLQIKEGEGGFYGINPKTGQAQPVLVGGPRGGGGNAPAYGSSIEEAAMQAIPGVRVTSRQRSAAHNAAVGGVSNSYHLTDNARDFVPPAGMTMAQLHTSLKKTLGSSGFDVINEGDHIHVEPGANMARLSGGQGEGEQLRGKPPVAKGAKISAEATKAQAALTNAVSKYDDTIAVARRLLNNPSLDSIIGNVQGNIPDVALSMSSQSAADALADYNQLRTVAGFQELQAMRNASPTGGALGQVSDSENRMLQQSAFASARSQSEAKFKQSVRDYIARLEASKKRLTSAYNQQFGGAASAAPTAATPAKGTRRPLADFGR